MDNEPRMNLDDDEMSLHSKLHGGGRDLGEEADKEITRLCPACGRVTTFVQGKCSNCEYKLGMSAGLEEATAMRLRYTGASQGSSSATRVMLAVLVLLLLAVVGYFGYNEYQRRCAEKNGEPGTSSTAPAGTAPAATPGVTPPDTYPGSLSVVAIDEAFRSKLKEALLEANTVLDEQRAGCYVYRFRIVDSVVASTSQTISISLFLGGEKAAEFTSPPTNEPIVTALKPVTDEIESHAGVTAAISYSATAGEEAADANDTYLRYGKDFALENMDRLQPVIDALKTYHDSAGVYPDQIAENIVSPRIKTAGTLSFNTNGFGYLPVYESDAKGNIVMGEGKGLASFKPKAVTGYYLVMYTGSETEGLDMYSIADYRYYTDNILPFPYEPKVPVNNMEFHPDGIPDGIACIVKNGKLQD